MVINPNSIDIQNYSKAIILSGSIALDAQQLQQDLTQLKKQSKVKLFIGGQSSRQYQKEIETAGAITLGSDFIVGLHTLTKHLPIKWYFT